MIKMQRFWVLKQLVCAVAILTAVRGNVLSSVPSGIKVTAVMTPSNLTKTCACLTHVTYTSAWVHIGQKMKLSKTRLITAFNVRDPPSLVTTYRTLLETKTFQVRCECLKLHTEQLVIPAVMKTVPENTCVFSRVFRGGWVGLVPVYAITDRTV
jgi:Zn finger protein HypA/HybF involved in hydrogenase expression